MVLAVAVLALGLLAAVVPFFTSRLGRASGYPLAAGFVAVGVLLGTQVPAVLRGEPVEGEWTWLPSLGVSLSLRLDGLSLLFCMLVLGVGALIMAYCARYLKPDDRHTRWYVLLTLFGVAMLGLLLAADLVVLFAFWELTTVTSFLLIGTAGPTAGRPAARALLVTGSGGLALLLAVVMVGVAAGTTDIATITANPQLVLGSPLAGPIGALVIVAAITKSAQLPFHFWLPDAMIAITPVSAYLHAATMVKAGVYLLMRFTPLYAGQPAWAAGVEVRLSGQASAFADPVTATEGPDGMYAEILSNAPRLRFAVEQLAREHGEAASEIAALGAVMDEVDGTDQETIERVRARGTDLLATLLRHRQRGADLVFEAYAQDIGGCD